MPISEHIKGLREKIGHELLLLPGVAAVIRDDAGRLLMQRRADDGTWGLPAGAVDPGEEPARALIREVWEETGLRVTPERVLGVFGGSKGFRFTYPNGDVSEYMVVVFQCRVVSGELECRDGESLELRWFARDELPPLRAGYPPEVLFASGAAPYFHWDEAWLKGLR
ncbi:MAG: NUDIX domain-containing protein [FCB group bacterium]|jgi:8-oxo-dGTP pyrophosphatase MutT (NUDIX family)|nr:NUDIX domain-containing protein [FCB group bacterium]